MSGPRPAFALRELDHVVLRVKDQDVSSRFYMEVLGLTLDHINEPARLVQLRCGRHLLDLLPLDAATPPAPDARMDHVCFSLACDDLPALAAWLKAQGITVEGDVVTRRGAFGTGPSLYLRDPDGYRLELKPA